MFQQTPYVFKTKFVPGACNVGWNSPEKVVKYLLGSTTLNSAYYTKGLADIALRGEETVRQERINDLFSRKRINKELMACFPELDNIYTPQDNMSGVFFINLTPQVKLIAEIHGISADGQTIIFQDDFVFSSRNIPLKTRDEARLKLLASMAVWGATHGIYYFPDVNYVVREDFDAVEWQDRLLTLEDWATNAVNELS